MSLGRTEQEKIWNLLPLTALQRQVLIQILANQKGFFKKIP